MLDEKKLKTELETIGFEVVEARPGAFAPGGGWIDGAYVASRAATGSDTQRADSPERLLRMCQEWASAHDVEVPAFYVDPRETALKETLPAGWRLTHASFAAGPDGGSIGAVHDERGSIRNGSDPEQLLQAIELEERQVASLKGGAA